MVVFTNAHSGGWIAFAMFSRFNEDGKTAPAGVFPQAALDHRFMETAGQDTVGTGKLRWIELEAIVEVCCNLLPGWPVIQ